MEGFIKLGIGEITIISAIFSLVYYLLIRLVGRRLRKKINAMVPLEELRGNIDYRQFFVTIVDKAFHLNMNFNFLPKFFEKLKIRTRPFGYAESAFHLTRAFGNLSEVQRCRFAQDEGLLAELKNILGDYNKSILYQDLGRIINGLANYYLIVSGSDKRIYDPQKTFQISKKFLLDLINCQKYLKDKDIFHIYFILVSWENYDRYKLLSDFEIIIFNHLFGKIQSFFQGEEYFIEIDDINQCFEIIDSLYSILFKTLKIEKEKELKGFYNLNKRNAKKILYKVAYAGYI